MSANKRLRDLNGAQTPQSSYGLGLNSRPLRNATHDTNGGRIAKRQRIGSPKVHSSHYFAGKPSAPRNEYQDMTTEGSQVGGRDPIDLVSNSSAGKTATAAASTSQSEYRSTLTRNKTKPARQRRKSNGPSLRIIQEAEMSERVASPELGQDPRAYGSASPDIFSEPLPVNVQPKLSSARKRERQPHNTDMTTHPVRKFRKLVQKPAEAISSDDELAMPGPSPDHKKARTTNFTGVGSRTQRGDIQSTNFQSPRKPQESRMTATKQGNFHDVLVKKAASGGFSHWKSLVGLHLGPSEATVEVASDQKSLHLPWLTIIREKIQKVEHSNNQFVIIYRSSTSESPRQLCLELESPDDAMKLVDWLRGPSWRHFHEESTEKIQRMFNLGLRNAISGKSPTVSKPSPPRDPWEPELGNLRPEKLKDKMQRSSLAMEPTAPPDETLTFVPPTRSQGVETRRTRRSSPALVIREASPDRWTKLNPNWATSWQRSVVFPPTGKNRAIVDKDDIPRLDEGEFLNDNLISFYFRHLQAELEVSRPEVLEKVYFFSTFFFEKLRSNRGKINYDGVKTWTAKVDLLSYKYIVVPVNENAHWYLAIIYNAPRMLPSTDEPDAPTSSKTIDVDGVEIRRSPKMAMVEQNMSFISLDDEDAKPETRIDTLNDVPRSSPIIFTARTSQETSAKGRNRKSFGGSQKFDPNQPRIITLDSLGSAHSPTCRCLRDYLMEEAKHKKGVEISNLPQGMTAKNIPEQNNYCDCGVFVLGYMEEFLKDPDEAVRRLLQKEQLEWNIRPSHIRNKVRTLLFDLQKEQQVEFEKEREKKRLARRKAQKEAGEAASSPRFRQESPKSAPKEPSKQQESPNDAPNEPPRQQGEVQEGGTFLLNGIKPSVERDDEQMPMSCISPGRALPKKGVQISSAKINAEPEFIPQLEEDSSESPRTSSQAAFLSGPSSSPKKSTADVSQNLVEPVKEEKSDDTGGSPRGQRASVEFVRELATTPEQASASQLKRKERTASPEVTIVQRGKHRKSPSPARRRKQQAKQCLYPSIESDQPSTGPQYDGIDRLSVDLTVEQSSA
ncbi:Fc.00g051250.m01.CDS01 [Cosmosporella sp. VM-42]